MTTVAEIVAARQEPLLAITLGSACIVVMNRPAARNALTRQMRRDFPALIEAAQRDQRVAALILTGTDPAFSAGVDLKERTAGKAAPVEPNPGAVLRAARKPVIAAVNGACVAGALEMALSCSFIIASTTAQFADTHAKVGLVPRWGATALLPNAIGARRATQMALTAAFIDAQTAHDWGMVNEIIVPERLLDRSLEVAALIAAADPRSIEAQFVALQSTLAAQLQPGLEAERRGWASWDLER